MKNSISRPTQAFIALTALGALGAGFYSLRQAHSWHGFEFPLLLLITALAARLKLKLPGVSGNMCMNLPFILIALVQLSPFEALVIAAVATLVQCLPASNASFQPVKALFNVSAIVVSVGAAAFIQQEGRLVLDISSGVALLVMAAASYCVVNTVLVAGVVSLSERAGMAGVWASIFQLSFPYYVASAGIAGILATATYFVDWPIPFLVLLVMYGIHRSYRLYFGRIAATA